MGLNYLNLDAETRKFMLEELEITVGDNKVYVSNYLSDKGKTDWLSLLQDACATGTDITLEHFKMCLNRFGIPKGERV